MRTIPARIRRAATAALVLVAGVTVALTASPAQAASAPLEYSTDGITWSATPLASLFTDVRFVPGDEQSRTIYVRNARGVPTSIMMAVSDITSDDNEFGTALTLAATDFASGGMPATSIAAIPQCRVIVPRRELGPGETMAVRLDLAVAPWLSGGNGQSGTANFSLLVGMADRDTPIAATGCLKAKAVIPAFDGADGTGGAGGGSMAFTGAQEPYAALTIAGIALGAGCFLIVLATRRRRRTEENPQ